MLGWFKKKDPFQINDSRAGDVAKDAATLLYMPLMMCKSYPNFHGRLEDPEVRGYMVGFFDAASQATQLSLPNDSQFFTFVGLCHKLLLNEVLSDPGTYAMSSLLMQHIPAFDRGQKLGGSEYFEFIKSRRPPMGLGRLIGQYDQE
ncbi:hypothetical protein [Stenotrophomonas hibiscicola]|uniref:hypothetical protein n=1 Tax=Stenotrophomonas hibiscicola TaxID=86189 RepID=UPI001312C5FB|nr:hypothetical protein [[Pseudomonas] hibiscicola]